MGMLGEEIASKYLENLDYYICERNFSTSFAEIDIICIKEEFVIFVEVKTRKNNEILAASDAVNPKKIRNIKKLAKHYIMENRLYDFNIRFDVVECYWENRKINHIIGAFD